MIVFGSNREGIGQSVGIRGALASKARPVSSRLGAVLVSGGLLLPGFSWAAGGEFNCERWKGREVLRKAPADEGKPKGVLCFSHCAARLRESSVVRGPDGRVWLVSRYVVSGSSC